MEADKTDWEFARLLAAKAKAGVKVRLVADRSGARMMGPKNLISTTEEEKLFKFYKDNGVEVVFYDRVTKGTNLKSKLDPFHFDHRKMFLIDGKTSCTGGYTLQAPSRETKHDLMALRGNYEQNIVSIDPAFVAKVRQDLLEKDFTVSKPYEPPKTWWGRFMIKAKGRASQLLDRFD